MTIPPEQDEISATGVEKYRGSYLVLERIRPRKCAGKELVRLGLSKPWGRLPIGQKQVANLLYQQIN
jgi:hypothetical protein